MKKRRISKKKVSIAVLLLLICIFGGCFTWYQISLKKIGNDSTKIEFVVSPNSTYSTLATSLKQHHLIRSPLAYKIYVKLNTPKKLEAGTYYLSKNMSVPQILKILSGSSVNTNVMTITVPEGKNMRFIASLLAKKTDFKEEEVFELLKDETYLNQLIQEYWFLTDEIKNPTIYYSLEGYLFPDTYEIAKDASIQDIFKVMLDQFGKKLQPFQKEIEVSSYTLHQMLTLASIIELEASNSDDRAGVAGVFYNRLEAKWALGSDVTTYYAIKVDMSERDLYQSELYNYNAYNTRSSKMAGKLPVSPICNPGIESIQAAIEPKQHNYFYFVADKNKKTYFSKTSKEHTTTVQKLKDEGLWYNY